MKRNIIVFTTAIAAMSLSVASCTPSGNTKPKAKFGFYVSLESGNTNLTKNVPDKVKITETNPDSTVRNYTYSVISGGSFLEVDTSGNLDPKDVTTEPAVVKVYESASKLSRTLTLNILPNYEKANGGYNFSTLEATKKAEILGELEKFAMNNFLTGITLFENGGYVKYSSRVKVTPTSYITGYGFGLLGEGELTEPSLPGTDAKANFPRYLQSASSSDPQKINAWSATGSQVGDLNSYITSSFFSTKLDPNDSTKYVWYPCLAQDTTNVKAVKDGVIVPTEKANEEQSRPVPVYSTDEENAKGLYKRWRIYVKVGNGTNGLQYHTHSSSLYSEYDGTNIVLDDYLTPFRVLLAEPTGLVRGAELATDTTYGIKGGYSYYRRTTKRGDDIHFINDTFNKMMNNGELGLKTGTDTNGSFIEFELINPVDSFTAMYTLSSNLYSPLPLSYLEKMATGHTTQETSVEQNWIPATVAYGTFSTKLSHEGFDGNTPSTKVIASHTLSVGPYWLEQWDKDQQVVFGRNDQWFERDAQHGNRYKIEGVRIRTIEGAQTSETAVYDQFEAGNLDSAGVPNGKDRTGAKQTKGDSTFKLNVNACDQNRWNELFGSNGSIKKGTDNKYTVNPAMHNNNFLRGLFWSINRKAFADKRGVTPSYNYFADAYLSDPDAGKSYNSTEWHEAAVEDFGIDLEKEKTNPQYGYDPAKAKDYFKLAISELLAEGAIKKGQTIKLRIQWMYPNDENEYGQDIANDFKAAFNDPNVGGAQNITLVVEHNCDQEWEQVYNDHLMVGEFDLGFGAISGNTLNPLNFMEVLKSDNSSGFTLNWGADTGKTNAKYRVIYDNKEWTYDSLWAAADHGAITNQNGEDVDPIERAYVDKITALDGETVTSDLRNGGIITIPVDFVHIPDDSVTFDISKVQIYLAGAEPFVVGSDQLEIIKETIEGKEVVKAIKITVTKAQAEQINSDIFTGMKLQKKIDDLDPTDPDYASKKDALEHPFTKGNYNIYWNVEINYMVRIKDSLPIEQTYYVAANKDEADEK